MSVLYMAHNDVWDVTPRHVPERKSHTNRKIFGRFLCQSCLPRTSYVYLEMCGGRMFTLDFVIDRTNSVLLDYVIRAVIFLYPRSLCGDETYVLCYRDERNQVYYVLPVLLLCYIAFYNRI